MPNRLAQETSPYLLQHQNNPVDWYSWGPEALSRAAAEQKPIFLSVGYSACHWCHVMEHESFEDEALAGTLNAHFVCIKVDREERPDIDHIYMQAVQMLTGRGGWPMSVFLTPDGQPFFGGTYWPPHAGRGMPGFDQVLAAIIDAWEHRREKAIEQASLLTEQLREVIGVPGAEGTLDAGLLTTAAEALQRAFDSRNGGFGQAPKFPHPMDLRLLLRVASRSGEPALQKMATLTLEKMAAGGIYDHLGGGFHRYSVDERWLVPHFEKMLYDNALLSTAYLEAYRATGRHDFSCVARETLDYVLREMTSPNGGFYSTQDADSEGVEGKFYVWTPEEIEEVLGTEAARTFCKVYDVSDAGNFEHHNILHLPRTIGQCAAMLHRSVDELRAELADSRAKLLAVRGRRVWPGLDDKILVSWNGLMIEALAEGAVLLDEPRYAAAARKSADFLLSSLKGTDGRLLHSYRAGQARFAAYLDDYACMAQSLVTLYEACFDEQYFDAAIELADVMLERFADPRGGFFYTADDHETLVARSRDVQDSSVPSGNAMAATVLGRLARLTGQARYEDACRRTLESFSQIMRRAPTATGQMLIALDALLSPARQAVFLADPESAEMSELLRELRRQWYPPMALACRASAERPVGHRSAALDALFAGKVNPTGGPMLYLCENFACRQPVSGREAIRAAWAGQG